MAEAKRYVVISNDILNKVIVGGPYLWDGEAAWQPPEAGRLMLESDALARGYTYALPETPAA